MQNNLGNKIIFSKRRKSSVFYGDYYLYKDNNYLMHQKEVHWAKERSSLFPNKEDLERWVSFFFT